jgi:replicative DNA helicase
MRSDLGTAVETHNPAQSRLNIERRLLHLLMSDAREWDGVGDVLTTACFTAAHGLVFEAIGVLIVSGKASDLDAVAMHLQRQSFSRELGENLRARLAHPEVSTAPARQLAVLLKEEWLLTRVQATGLSIQRRADSSEPLVNVLNDAAEEIQLLQDALPCHATMRPFEECLVRRLDGIIEAAEGPSPPTTSFPENILEWLAPGQLVGLVGPDSVGKTTLAAQIFSRLLQQSNGACFFSMEMPSKDITSKVLATTGQISLRNLKTGALTDVEWRLLTPAIDQLRTNAGFVDDSESVTFADISTRCGRIKRQAGVLSVVIVDHLRCLELAPGDTLVASVAKLKAMARRLQCAVLLLAHDDAALRISADVIAQLEVCGGTHTLSVTKGRLGEDDCEPMKLSLSKQTATFLASPAKIDSPQDRVHP